MHNPKVTINNQLVASMISFEIRQQFNKHHTFKCSLYGDIAIVDTLKILEDSKSWLGKNIVITLQNGKLNFKGVICRIKVSQTEMERKIIVSGYSPTILLETEGGHYDSFDSLSLKNIVTNIKSKSNINNNLKWEIAPEYKEIKYVTQYNESYFAFLNRLSATYGEFFFYNGETIHFGKPNRFQQLTLHAGEILSISQGIRILPMNFKYHHYDYLNPGEDPYQGLNRAVRPPENALSQHAVSVSRKKFKVLSDSHSPIATKNVNSLKTEKTKSLYSKLIDVKGESNNCSLNIGCKVTIYPKDPHLMGEFLITEISHTYSEIGGYINSFSGILADADVLDVQNVRFPKAEPQIAHVKNNLDPENLGRVKVQMLWQRGQNTTTDWIRCFQQDAGEENRGFSFVPEVGDEVILGFQYKDPDRPFVMGSVFNKFKDVNISPLVRTVRYKGNILCLSNENEKNLTLKNQGNSIYLDANLQVVDIISNRVKISCEYLNVKVNNRFKVVNTRVLSSNTVNADIQVSGDYVAVIQGDYQLGAAEISESAF